MRSETGVIRDVILPEGTTLRLRAATQRRCRAGSSRSSSDSVPESRYFRFHGLPPVGPRLVEPFLDPDWDERGALVGTLAQRGRASGSWRSEPGRASATARAPRQRLRSTTSSRATGSGHVSSSSLRASPPKRESSASSRRFCPSNLSMLRVFEHVGFAVTRELEGGVVEVVFPIAPTESYRETVDSRDHLGVVASLGPFFSPESVAVSAPRRGPGTIGGLVFRNIVERRLHRARLPGEPRRRRRRRRAGLRVARPRFRSRRPRGLLPARRARARGSGGRPGDGRAGALRHLRRIRRDRRRRERRAKRGCSSSSARTVRA